MSAARAARRVVTLPLALGWHLLVLVGSPLGLTGAAVLGVVTRSSRPVRTVLLLTAHTLIELRALARVAALRRPGRPATEGQWDDLVRWVLVRGYAAVRRILGVRVVLEGGSAAPADVRAADGLVVLARHCGPGDSLLVAWLLVVHYGLSLRIVLKSLLRVDPAIDLAGDALPFCFVGHRHGAARRGVEQLAAGLRPGQALLLFPEGGNFSRRRWAEAVRRLSSAGELLRARWARRNTHTLPPHAGGTAAALLAAPRSSVLLLAHSGLGPGGGGRAWWRLPVGTDLLVRTLLVPPTEIARDEDAVAGWLDDAWARVDTWVDGHAQLASVARTAG